MGNYGPNLQNILDVHFGENRILTQTRLNNSVNVSIVRKSIG